MLTIRFTTDSAAFTDGAEPCVCLPCESARILRDIARKIELGQYHGKIRDGNGNTIGTYHLDE
jgi:hypothetical protein